MPHSKFDMQELAAMRGKPVYGSEGEKLGDFEEIYRDELTQQPEWISVKEPMVGGLLGTNHYVVPIVEAQLSPAEGREESAIQVPYSKEQVKDAPQVEGEWISEEQERELFAYYGLEPSQPVSQEQFTGTEPAQQSFEGTPRDVSLSRHEEELRVGKRETESGRVRLRKWVETEPVSEDVALRRETARVERHEVDRPAPGAEIREEEAEMQLHREEPVVSEETVEKERTSLEQEEEVEKESVHGEVRREHIEVDDDSEDPQEEHRH